MLNIMKADMYRILRGKGFYITLIIFVLFIVLQTASSNTGTIGIAVMESGGEGVNVSVNEIDANINAFTGMTAPFEMMGITDNLLYFILPFIIFIGSEDFSSGAAKNVLTNGMPRAKYYFSKLIMSCAVCVCILLLNIILPIITATIFNGFGGTFGIEFLGKVIRPFLGQLFMCLSVTCVGVFFVFATKRTAAVNGAYIAFCFVPVLLIFILVQINADLKFLFDYDIVMNIRMLTDIDTASSTDIIRAFAIGGFYMLASTIGGIVIFKRSEVQ